MNIISQRKKSQFSEMRKYCFMIEKCKAQFDSTNFYTNLQIYQKKFHLYLFGKLEKTITDLKILFKINK